MENKPIIIQTAKLYQGSAFESFLNGLAVAFEQLGESVFFCHLDSASSINRTVEMMVSGNALFSLSLNEGMMVLGDGKNTVNVFENLDIPHVSILQDAPYSKKVGNLGIPAKNHIICYLDRSHRQMLKKCYIDKRFAGSLFLPMAGSSLVDDDLQSLISSETKAYDVVYCAGFWGNGSNERSWNTDGTNRYIAGILNDVADLMECRAINSHDAFGEVLSAHGMEFDEVYPGFKSYFWPMLEYIKGYRRFKVLQMAVDSGIKVDVFGGGWEQAPFADKLNLHGPVSYQDSVRAIAQAKVLLQDQAEFNDGAHDRVFTAMLNGTAVVSEYSCYLDEIFTDGHEINMFDWNKGAGQLDVIHELLRDDSRRLSGVISAYGKSNRDHRWLNRAERILEMVELCKRA